MYNSAEIEENLFQQQPTVQLHLGLLNNINLALYPKEKIHYLAYALQHGQEIPSIATMNTSEAGNKVKSGAEKASTVTARKSNLSKGPPILIRNPFSLGLQPMSRVIHLPIKFGLQPRVFSLPMKFGPQPRALRGQTAIKDYRYGRVIPKAAISLPSELSKTTRARRAPKIAKACFKTRSP